MVLLPKIDQVAPTIPTTSPRAAEGSALAWAGRTTSVAASASPVVAPDRHFALAGVVTHRAPAERLLLRGISINLSPCVSTLGSPEHRGGPAPSSLAPTLCFSGKIHAVSLG